MRAGRLTFVLALLPLPLSSAAAQEENCQIARVWRVVDPVADGPLEGRRILQTFNDGKAYLEIELPLELTPNGDPYMGPIAFFTSFDTEMGNYRLDYDVTMESTSRQGSLVVRPRPSDEAPSHLWRETIFPDKTNTGSTVIEVPPGGIDLAIIFSAKEKSRLWAGPVKLCKI